MAQSKTQIGADGRVVIPAELRREPKLERGRRPRGLDRQRRRQLQADARRPMSENLAEGIALSHMLHRFTGAARRK
ncbi:MAG: hypothetical protein ACR2G3_07625 [Solirubrobacterales bacterium]